MKRLMIAGALCGIALSSSACGKKASASDLSEAKNTVGAILRSASQAYDREQAATELIEDDAAKAGPSHKLCGSASPFPRDMPTEGKKAQPEPSDFKATSPTNGRDQGWMCLRFESVDPTRFQYTYVVGGPYKGPARGGKDPGPNGFEACAEADFQPGGPTTLVCGTGTADPKSGEAKLETSLFVAEE
jgi:hypothetical protein